MKDFTPLFISLLAAISNLRFQIDDFIEDRPENYMDNMEMQLHVDLEYLNKDLSHLTKMLEKSLLLREDLRVIRTEIAQSARARSRWMRTVTELERQLDELQGDLRTHITLLGGGSPLDQRTHFSKMPTSEQQMRDRLFVRSFPDIPSLNDYDDFDHLRKSWSLNRSLDFMQDPHEEKLINLRNALILIRRKYKNTPDLSDQLQQGHRVRAQSYTFERASNWTPATPGTSRMTAESTYIQRARNWTPIAPQGHRVRAHLYTFERASNWTPQEQSNTGVRHSAASAQQDNESHRPREMQATVTAEFSGSPSFSSTIISKTMMMAASCSVIFTLICI